MKLNSIDYRLLKGFFRCKFNLKILGISFLLLLSALLYFLFIPAQEVFPARKDLKFVFYSDSINGGHSSIIRKQVTDAGLVLDFDLKEGFLSPYVGISISRDNSKEMDLGLYNQLCMEVGGTKVNGLAVTLYTANPFSGKKLENLCFTTKFAVSPTRTTYKIGIDQLKTPDWWYDNNNISQDLKAKPDWSHLYNINIGSAYTSLHESPHSLQIHRIWFERNNTIIIRSLFLTEVAIFLLLVFLHYIKAKKEKTKHKPEPIRIEYKSVELPDETESVQTKGFLTFISSNYHDPELSLESVASKTGIHSRHITKHINETFGCNFKTYVNRIRISESKRLLVETELNIGEIAFKVGFSNQSHFNRVFKIMEGISPSEFREGRK